MNGVEYEIPIFPGRMRRRTGVAILIIVFVNFMIEEIIKMRFPRILLLLEAAVLILLGEKVKHLLERCVWRIEANGVRRTVFGVTKYISYGEIAEAMRARKIEVTSTAFRIPENRGYISFYYEVGNGPVQSRIMEAYRFFAGKVPGPLPKLSYNVIGNMDRSFYYKKERRNSSIIMIAASIALGTVDGDSVAFGCICAALGLIVQYAVLGNLFTAVYFGKKVEKKIQDLFAQYPNVKLRKVRISYVKMLFIIFAAVGMNMVFLFI